MAVELKRVARHLLSTPWTVKQAFPRRVLAEIEHSIELSEATHDGEIRFAVETALSGMPLFFGLTPRERAIDVFSHLRMWDTEHRNGILIYLLLADRSVEIIADRGVHAKADTAAWDKICRDMETAYRNQQFEQGTIMGIQAIGQLLHTHFPSASPRKNELPNQVVLL